MLHEAKLVYFTKRMIPAVADTVLFGFTDNQLRFLHGRRGYYMGVHCQQ